MTRARRFLAFVLEVLLLQVSILGAGMPCAPGAFGQSVGAERSAASVEHAAHQHAAQATADHVRNVHEASPVGTRSARSLESPGTPPPQHEHAATHCLLAGGCAVIAVASPSMLVATVTSVHRTVDVADEHLRRSPRPTPEPPPPRA